MIRRIKEVIASSLQSTSAFEKIASSHASGIISDDCFSDISPCANDFTYIDGGQNVLYVSPSLAIQFIRIACVKQKDVTLHEYIVLCHLRDSKYNVEYLPITHHITLPSFFVLQSDSYVTQSSLPITRVLGLSRRLAEIHIANSISDSVIDGSLQTFHPLETIKSHVVGVSKTISYVTTSGRTLTYALSSYRKGSWVAIGLLEQQYSVGFCSLHSKSQHVVKVETYLELQEIVNKLASDATDPTSLGYPYGLVKADMLARISETEREYWKTKLFMQFDSLTQEQLSMMAQSIDFHTVLDSMRF